MELRQRGEVAGTIEVADCRLGGSRGKRGWQGKAEEWQQWSLFFGGGFGLV